MLRVHLFGRPRLSLGEVPLPVGGRPKVVPLLAYLLLHRATALPRQTLANALWPDEPEDEARANLRRHLNYLHGMLPPPVDGVPWLIAIGGRVQWNAECSVWLDVAEFERLAALPERLSDAVALYDGDLLVDVEEEWLDAERERLAALYSTSLATLVARTRAARDYGRAIAAARALLAVDPWREDTLRSLLLLRYESGDRAGALAEYERFAGALHAELGAEPMAETAAVYAAIVRDDVPVETPFAQDPQRGAFAENADALPFVGRAVELDVLRERWDGAAAGHGALVLIGGEAGIGKTRLVREFVASCEARGAQTYAAATTFPEPTPYQPFVTLLRLAAPLAETLSIDPLWLSAIAPLVPSVAQYAHDLRPLGAIEPARDRLRLFEACANVFTVIAARRPLVLVVEDLQWAGAATLGLLEHLARRAQHSRILVLATYREDELDLRHQLRATRRRLENDGTGVHLALSALSRDTVEELVQLLADSGDAEALARVLHARSDGNPFFLAELLRDLAETGRLRIVDRRWSSAELSAAVVPSAVRDAVAARVARLNERPAALAATAAVIGRAFDVELLRETVGWAEANVLDALSELVDRRIVSEHGTRGTFDYAFSHDLIRAVVYENVAPADRAYRHRRVAHVMEALYAELGDDVSAELALHWDRGGDARRAAEHYLRAARHAASVYGNDEAAAFLARALDLTASIRTRFEALLLRERLTAARGDRAAQASDIAELVALAPALADDDAACTVLERRVELADVTGDRRAQRVLLRLLQRRVGRSGDARWRARALQCEARYLRGVNDFAAARGAFAELMALAQRSGDRTSYVSARLAFADSYIFEGRLGEAHAALDELRAVVQADGNQAALVRTLMAFSRAALLQQDYAAMSQFATDALDVSRTIGDREGEALALHTMANGLVYTFRVADAESYYLRAMELYERMNHRVGLASIYCDLGLFHTELGLLERALTFYARAREIALEIGFPFVVAVERINASYCRRLRGEFALASDAAESALAVTREIRSQHLESAALGVLGAAESALGADAAAIAHLQAGIELRRPAGATPRLGENLCALARACLRAGDVAAARAAADEMLALYESNPKLAPQPAEWLLAAADVAAAHGRADAADRLLQQADSVMRARAAAIDDADTRAAYLALPFNVAIADARATRA